MAKLRNLYLETYVERLRHREMKPDFMDVYEIKSTLWKYRMEMLKENKSDDWVTEDIPNVLKKLKNNKSRDPDGYLNEIFKPNIIGSNLRDGLLQLANGIKRNMEFPAFIQKANISTIFKKRGSRLSMENDRGIFSIHVLMKIVNGLIYDDKYQDIDSNMSDSNIGGRRNKNIRNHLFIIYGIINSVMCKCKI